MNRGYVYESFCGRCTRVTSHVEGTCLECCGFPRPAIHVPTSIPVVVRPSVDRPRRQADAA